MSSYLFIPKCGMPQIEEASNLRTAIEQFFYHNNIKDPEYLDKNPLRIFMGDHIENIVVPSKDLKEALLTQQKDSMINNPFDYTLSILNDHQVYVDTDEVRIWDITQKFPWVDVNFFNMLFRYLVSKEVVDTLNIVYDSTQNILRVPNTIEEKHEDINQNDLLTTIHYNTVSINIIVL